MGGAVEELDAQGVVSIANVNAGQSGVHQGTCDAQLDLVTQQVLGVFQLERQSEEGRDGSKSDVTLVPVEPYAEDLFLPLPRVVADHPRAGHRARIRSCAGFRQGECRDFQALGETG